MKKFVKKRYFIRNHDVTAGTEWIEITGREFYKLIKSERGKNMLFENIGDYVFEVTEEQYRQSMIERHRHCYLMKTCEGISISSIYDITSDKCDEQLNGEEVIADAETNVEDQVISNITIAELKEALKRLTVQEYLLIYDLFLSGNPKSERQVGKKLNISQAAVHKQKKKIFSKIQKLLVIKTKKIRELKK